MPGIQSHPDLDAMLAAIDRAVLPEQIWQAMQRGLRGAGVRGLLYQHQPPQGMAGAERPRIGTAGLPEDWVDDYLRRALYRCDPLVRHAATTSEPFAWEPVDAAAAPGSEEAACVAARHAAGLRHGVAMEVFGPSGRSGVFALVTDGPGEDIPRETLLEIHWACQFAHLRFCSLLQGTQPPAPELSMREHEILSFMAQGKSNSAIAQILGLSSHTVDAYVRRIYQKLGTSDRVTTALAALGLGLLARPP